MAKTLLSVHFFAIFFVFILIATPQIMVEAKLCERPSLTWSGKCGITSHCDTQCRTWEDARHGACHKRESQWKCFCYFDCKEKNDQKSG